MATARVTTRGGRYQTPSRSPCFRLDRVEDAAASPTRGLVLVLDLEHLATAIGAARGTDAVTQLHLAALRAELDVGRGPEPVVTATHVATTGRGTFLGDGHGRLR